MTGFRFARYEVPGLVERPPWWQVRLEEIDRVIGGITRGSSRSIAITPGGHAVRAVFYNCAPLPPPPVNWAAAASSFNPEKYKTSGYSPQTVMLCAGVHGAEPEGVAALVNIISLLETGRDLRGWSDDAFIDLLRQYRLVLVPCANPDGRAICPDHLRGATYEEFRKASQGSWLTGKFIEWQESKEYFPLPLDKVEFPGGYPNGAGYNIQHDSSPGNLRTAEADAIMKLSEAEQVDLFLNLHSYEGVPMLLPPGEFNYARHLTHGLELRRLVWEAFARHGLIDCPYRDTPGKQAINLNLGVTMSSGALAITFESTVKAEWSFDQILESHYILFRTILEDGLKNKFAPRGEIVKNENRGVAAE